MMLEELIRSLDVDVRVGAMDVTVTGVTDDSRAVRAGHLFVAVRGGRVDGHEYVRKAAAAGAAALVVQTPMTAGMAELGVPVVSVADSRRAVGLLAGRFHGEPSSRLRLVGVTGTNGKTTTTYLCKAILEAAGRSVGLIGTVAYQIGNERLEASHTTPGAVELHGLLARMVAAGANAAVMEVSSHALALDRVAGCEFDVAVFTNLTQDHLDFHADLDDYFHAKLRLFTGLGASPAKPTPKRAVVNADDPRGDLVRKACPAPVWTYALRQPADIRAEEVRLAIDGTAFLAVTPVGRFPVESRLVGEHNVSNALAAIGVALAEGIAPDHIRRGIRSVANVPGRFERVDAGQNFTVIVDYAHTEDALVRLLDAARRLSAGRLITVFGCGGDRDRGKRPKMGRAAAERSDVVVLTSDNPRSEEPTAILREIEAGVRSLSPSSRARYQIIPDRRRAIEAAVDEARAGDTVLLAGKGHEDYQIVGGQRWHFDDREEAREAIRRRMTRER
jgi:UDP-N-acetylmuramoyl-L-alanyl-D-glutamate--2,6-diaminopimelate ligase